LYGGGGDITFNRPYDPYDPDNLDEKNRRQNTATVIRTAGFTASTT